MGKHLSFGLVSHGTVSHPCVDNPTGRHIVVVDPNLLEETVQDGQITFVLNMHKEVCALTKYGGCPLPPDVILNCANIASIKATEITKVIKDAVREATSKFEQ